MCWAPLVLNPLSCEHCLSLGCCCCSVTESCPTLQPHGLQHTRLPCPSPSSGVCSNSCPLSWRCHLAISSSVTPLLLPPSIFPRIRVCSNEWALPVRWSKYWSFSFSVSPSNKYSGLISFRMDWLDLLAGLSRVFSSSTVQKHQFFSPQPSLCAAVENTITGIINTILLIP